VALKLSIMLDSSTARLLAVAQALQACDALPTASAKSLVGQAKAVRLFAAAREYAEAKGLCDEIDAWADGGDVENAASLKALLGRHTDAVRKACGS
jgi:hypothetical protein